MGGVPAVWVAPIVVVVVGSIVVGVAAARTAAGMRAFRASLLRLRDVRSPFEGLKGDVETLRATVQELRRR